MVSIRQILERLEGLYSDNDNVEDENRATGTDGNLCSTVPNGRAGRPAFLITEEQIRGLREGADFRWSDIARILGVSTRTLSRHRQGFGMPVGQEHNFSQITDFALDNVIRDVLTLAPQSGVGLFCGALRSRGLRVQRHRVIAALQRLDPVTSALRQTRRIIRRTYNVPCPNPLW